MPEVEEMEQLTESQLRPNVSAYLQYLKNEEQVTDEAYSQIEVSRKYIQHNANRVKALRQFATKLASQIDSDYMPELQAVSGGELSLLLGRNAPKISALKIGQTYNLAFRFLGTARNVETFYVFSRLSPFEEQAERDRLVEKPENAKVEEDKSISSPKPKRETTVGSKQTEKPLTREMMMKDTAEKRKEIFVKKNP